MKTAEAKKYVGIEHDVIVTLASHYYVNKIRCKIVQIAGRNLLVDLGGMTDWLWLPGITSIKIADD